MPQAWTIRFCAAILALTGVLHAEENTLRIPFVSRAPKLADYLNNVPREAEAVVTDFRQFDPGDGVPVTQPTTAYLSYDHRNLYVGFVCRDDPALIRARVAKRKDIMVDDRVTINIDTFHDHKRAYFFDVNPYGVQMDGITTDGQGDDFTFETLWFTEAKIVEDGYVVLITIPFRSLRFPEGKQQEWGVILARFIQRNNEFSIWPHVSRQRLPQFVGQFGHMEGLDGISPGRNIQFIPYLLSSKARFFDSPAGGAARYTNDHEIRGGLDAKMVLRDALALDVTVNPDFSQVESDEPQVTVNQRYEVFFPERRPFFTENGGMFATPENLFFSRRIVDPQFGARLTGKVGRWALAGVVADDRAPGELVPAGDPLEGDRAGVGVLRVQREFGKQSHFGALLTDREFAGGWNRVGAFDARLNLPGKWTATGQVVESLTRDPGAAATVSGQALNAKIGYSTRKLIYSTSYIDRSPGFRSDLGFIQRVNIRQLEHRLDYRWWPKNRTLVDYGPSLYGMTNWDHAGRLVDWAVMPGFTAELKRLTVVGAQRRESFELFQNIGFRKGEYSTWFSTEWFRWMALAATWGQGKGVNYYPAAGLSPFAAHWQSGSLQVTFRPRPKLKLNETYYFTRLAAAAHACPLCTSGQTVFNDHVLRSRVNYQFTRALSLRAILDYHGVLPNRSLVALDNTKRLAADVLLAYLLNPGTALYLGYTSAYENFIFDPAVSPAWQRTSSPAGLSGRQIFVKLSYLFRY